MKRIPKVKLVNIIYAKEIITLYRLKRVLLQKDLLYIILVSLLYRKKEKKYWKKNIKKGINFNNARNTNQYTVISILLILLKSHFTSG